MDARRNQVYTGLYRFEKDFQIVMESCAMDIHDLIQRLNEMGERVIFLGDGMPVCRKFLEEEMTVSWDFAPAQCNRQRAASVAALGARYLEAGKVESAKEHRPDYLRKAQAERELEEAKRQGKVKELAAGHSVGTGESDMASGGLKTGERMEGQKAGTGAEAGKGNAPEEENR